MKTRKSKVIVVAVLGVIVLAVGIFLGRPRSSKTASSVGSVASVKSVATRVNRNLEFASLTSQAKPNPTGPKIKMTITDAEKTSQVIVGDKTFTAKNKKLFLILNLELRNDSSTITNIVPGDLIRLTYGGVDDKKYAPDLHNNLVAVSAISTKLDRVGFVIPDNQKEFKIFVGELDGKKDIIVIRFES